MANRWINVLVVVVALAATAIVVPHANSFVILLATRALAFAILVMSVDILLGYTGLASLGQDRKSTRLNSSHLGISYAVFCLKKKNNRIYRLLLPKETNKTHTHQSEKQ